MKKWLFENDRPIAVQEDPLFEHELDRLCQHDFLDIATCLHHGGCGVSMIYRNDPLGDNRPGVEIVGHDMRGRADDLYTPLVCLMVRLGADKGR